MPTTLSHALSSESPPPTQVPFVAIKKEKMTPDEYLSAVCFFYTDVFLLMAAVFIVALCCFMGEDASYKVAATPEQHFRTLGRISHPDATTPSMFSGQR